MQRARRKTENGNKAEKKRCHGEPEWATKPLAVAFVVALLFFYILFCFSASFSAFSAVSALKTESPNPPGRAVAPTKP